MTTLSNTPHPPPPDGSAPADAAVSPVERVLAAARHRAASRRLHRAAAKAGLAPVGPARAALPPAPGRREMLKCRTCGRTEPRPADDLGRLARGSWPECCGKVMPPAPVAPEPEAVPPAEPIPERRASVRRPARHGARAELRRGLMGMGPDLAVALLDVSLEGARIRLKAPVCPGEQVEVALWPPGGLRSARGPAIVCWCRPAADGTAQAGVRFRQRLTANDLAKLVQ